MNKPKNGAGIDRAGRPAAGSPQPRGADLLREEEREHEGLVELARRGDRDALGCLLARARPRALAVALRMTRDPDDAEDVVQEAFIKALRGLARFQRRAAFTTWLHRIVVNTCLDQLRRRDARPPEGGSAHEDGEGPVAEAVDADTPERRLDRAETRAIVHRALSSLAPLHRQVLALREIEEMSYLEAARRIRCPVGTVMSRLYHARRRLAAELGRPAARARVLEAA